MQSIELSGISPRDGIFPGIQDGGSMLLMLGDGSTFSLSSILSAKPSQLIWKRVTRGLEAKIFLWSWHAKKQWFRYQNLITKNLTFPLIKHLNHTSPSLPGVRYTRNFLFPSIDPWRQSVQITGTFILSIPDYFLSIYNLYINIFICVVLFIYNHPIPFVTSWLSNILVTNNMDGWQWLYLAISFSLSHRKFRGAYSKLTCKTNIHISFSFTILTHIGLPCHL